MLRHLRSTAAAATAAMMMTGAAWTQPDHGRGVTDGATTGGPAGQRVAQGTTSPASPTSGAWDIGRSAAKPAQNAGALADRVIGLPVLTEDGEQVGDVEDLIVDQDRRVRGVVVAVGEFLGMGIKEVGVAWDRAEVRSTPETGEVLILRGLTSDDIDTAPSLETDPAVERRSRDLDSPAAGQTPSMPAAAPAR